ncbi:virion structural protein [Pseudomonas phage PaMx42]|uniref:virion structural protein n=1 Tax=Pseudomonas phage PaMx42 TaxID=1175662 RepID=UPI0007228735|nr:virion structural protein [Pseudomonas phage PaMx42]ALH23588.1 virion structural protein [Pseudomonas phage PaMx42]
MAAKKVIFFTAGTTPTSGELAAIAKLNAAADKPYEVTVMNGAANTKYGETNRLAPCDFVAGTVPTIYNAKTVLDPDAIPVQNLPNTQAVVTNGQKITGVTGSGTVANIVVNPTTKAVTVTLSAS